MKHTLSAYAQEQGQSISSETGRRTDAIKIGLEHCSNPMVPVLYERFAWLLVVVAWAALLARLEALAAVHRLAWAWVERHFGILAALRAGCRVKGALATVATVAATAATAIATAAAVAIATGAVTAAAIAGTVAVATAALGLACLSAAWASLRIRESTGRVKILLTGRKGELVATIAAGKRSIAHYSLNLSRPSH